MEPNMLRPELKQQHNTNHQTHAHAAVDHSAQWDRGCTGTTPIPVLDIWASHIAAATSKPELARVPEYATDEHESARSSPPTDGDSQSAAR
jgi:hypothetical protein